MQPYDITVRFMRTIQVREYEPACAEVTIKAQLADGEDASKAIADAFKDVSAQVHTSLGLAADTKLPQRRKSAGGAVTTETMTAKPAETPKPAETAQAQTGGKPAPVQTKASVNDDIPGEAAPAKTTAPAAAQSDIPDSPAPAAAQTAPAADAIPPAELSKWIGEQVKSGNVTSAEIMALYPRFKVSRFADLKPDQTAEAKAAIEEIIKKRAAAL